MQARIASVSLVNGACSTEPNTAAELRTSQAYGVTEIPQQRRVRVAVERVCYAVYFELNRICHIVKSAALRVPPEAMERIDSCGASACLRWDYVGRVSCCRQI